MGNIYSDIYSDVVESINNCDMVLIGMGDELSSDKVEDIIQILNELSIKLEHKNYFIISSNRDSILKRTTFSKKRVVMPCEDHDNEDSQEQSNQQHNNQQDNYEQTQTELEKQWELYNKWLSATLNKKLVILELGEGFNMPNLMRWPFEKVAFINAKAKFYRINETFPQIPDNLGEKAFSVKENASEFIMKIIPLLPNNV